MKFCPSCGKDIREGTFCEDCQPLPEIKVKEVKVKICAECDKYLHKNRWKRYDKLEDAVKAAVNTAMKRQLEDYDLDIAIPKHKKNPGIELDFETTVKKGKNFFVIPGTIFMHACNVCSKKGTNYFEGTLQLRNPSKEILEFIDSFFKSKQKEVLITKKVKVDNGLDITLSSKKYLSTLGDKLVYHFGGTLKKSANLHTHDHQTSKDVFRLNVLYEAHDFSTGDVISYKGKVIKVNKLGKMIYGTDLTNNKPISFKVKEDIEVLKKHKTSVAKIQPRIEVIDPTDYQSKPVVNKKEVKIGEKVKVVEHEGNLYLV